MILGDDLDPQLAGLAAGASVLGKLSGASRTPVGIGSILGQLGGAMYGAQQSAAVQKEKLASDKMMREAQVEELKAKIAERKRAVESQAKFNSILGVAENPSDPITILGAGLSSGAFGPKETTSFMSTVLEKQNARQQRLDELKLRLEDRKIAQEERQTFQ